MAFVCLLAPQRLPGAIAGKVQGVAALGQVRAWCSSRARRAAGNACAGLNPQITN